MNKIRFNQFGQKLGGLSTWLNVTLLLAAALAFCAIPSDAFAEGDASDDRAAPCKGLKPFKNLDELLYQFGINLDSDCLFEMPVEELEKIWDIKILSKERRKPKNYYPLSETEFYNKPYKSERDAFYVEMDPNSAPGKNIFLIRITRDYQEKHGALYAGKYPDFLYEFLSKNPWRKGVSLTDTDPELLYKSLVKDPTLHDDTLDSYVLRTKQFVIRGIFRGDSGITEIEIY